MTITAGMTIGTLFTLFVLPTFFLPFGRERSEASQSVPIRENAEAHPAKGALEGGV